MKKTSVAGLLLVLGSASCQLVLGFEEHQLDPTGGGPTAGGGGATGGCKAAAPGTSCGEPSCSNGATFTPTCDDSGSCDDTKQSCDGHTCSGLDCGTDCMRDDALCVATHFCNAGSCVADLNQGAVCDRPEQCPGGNCVDGVCCSSPCGGECELCQADGVCGLVPNGTDDTPSCPGNQTCCNGSCQSNCP